MRIHKREFSDIRKTHWATRAKHRTEPHSILKSNKKLLFRKPKIKSTFKGVLHILYIAELGDACIFSLDIKLFTRTALFSPARHDVKPIWTWLLTTAIKSKGGQSVYFEPVYVPWIEVKCYVCIWEKTIN